MKEAKKGCIPYDSIQMKFQKMQANQQRQRINSDCLGTGKGITKGYKGNFGRYGYGNQVDYGDDFTGVYMLKLMTLFYDTLNTYSVYCMLITSMKMLKRSEDRVFQSKWNTFFKNNIHYLLNAFICQTLYQLRVITSFRLPSNLIKEVLLFPFSRSCQSHKPGRC